MQQKKIFRPHYSTTTDARVIQTRDALRNAFLELLNEKTYEQITIREITAKASIGYTTFFRHYPSKEELLDTVAFDEIATLIDLAINALGSSDTHAAATTLCGYVGEHRILWRTLLTGGASSRLREEFVRIAREIAAAWHNENHWLPADLGVIVVSSGTIELLAWWLGQEEPMPANQLAEIYERIVINPVIKANNTTL
ncbi:TetR/AcrR family transcriptional regulator [Zhongshania aquimaris]|uniref:TetR/AcrR family transcriptional regulator n=1 Tax=Zhongshania aquimaris TaxID=2857107 RepID=A0ABS6VVW7_9GAMM|nr:TetR/AcrR family transcriptional regulator [Zhongshania aquimaris]MBW2942497.1 TetR/AcrR family transcriptional regulator [Zhongshania aquimaris]